MTFVDAGLGNSFAEHGRALRTMDHVAEKAPAIIHVPALREQSRTIRKRVFHCIVVKQLIGLGTDLTPSLTLSRYRPSILAPAAHIEVVDQPVENETTVQPSEAALVLDLVS